MPERISSSPVSSTSFHLSLRFGPRSCDLIGRQTIGIEYGAILKDSSTGQFQPFDPAA